MASSPKTVAIIGSAIAGPTLALQILSNSVLRSARFLGLFANGLYPLHRLGLEDDIRREGYECRALSFWQCDYEGKHENLAHQDNAMWSPDLQTGVVYFERHGLQSLLVDKVKRLGGEVFWEKKAISLETLDTGQTRVSFSDGTDISVDLLVGADGGYSAVRKYILNQRDSATAEARWLPDFMGITGLYGVGDATQAAGSTVKASESHCLWLDRGFLASGPCPDGKIR